MDLELTSNSKSVPYLSFYQILKFGKFWSKISVVFIICKLGSDLENKKIGLAGRADEQCGPGKDTDPHQF
jgi:hypothetical protein